MSKKMILKLTVRIDKNATKLNAKTMQLTQSFYCCIFEKLPNPSCVLFRQHFEFV